MAHKKASKKRKPASKKSSKKTTASAKSGSASGGKKAATIPPQARPPISLDEYSKKHHDPVLNPRHHTHGGIDAIAVLEAKMSEEELRGFHKGRVLYLAMSAGHRHGSSARLDLQKAQWHLTRLINLTVGE